jgi:hypothetical protein
MSKQEITISLSDEEIGYLSNITKDLKLSSIDETLETMIKDTGKNWYATLNEQKFISKIKNIPIEGLADIISSLPFLSRRYKKGFDAEILDMIIERLMDWEESVPELVKNLYRLNNIRIMANDIRVLTSELTRETIDDSGIDLPLFDKELVIRLLVSALYRT